MKPAFLSLAAAFLLGLVLKTVQVPFAPIILVCAAACGLLLALAGLTVKRQRAFAFFQLTAWSWAVLLVFTLMFWPWQAPLLVICLGLTAVFANRAFKRKERFRAGIIGGIAIVVLAFHLLPAHQRFAITDIHLNPYQAEDPIIWDRYAWFLNKSEHRDEALAALQRGIDIAEHRGQPTVTEALRMHLTCIREGRWVSYSTAE